MHGLKGERVLMRVYVEEQDKFDGHPLYERIVSLMRGHHFAGATAFRATPGFGLSSHVHEAHTVHLKLDQPIIIEAIDSEERIQSILPELDRMIGGRVDRARAGASHYVSKGRAPERARQRIVDGHHRDLARVYRSRNLESERLSGR